MTREELPSVFTALSTLLEVGDPSVEEGCLQVVERFPDAHEFWCLRSKSLSAAGRAEEALHDIITACKLAPTNVDYMFHYFNVRIQLSQPEYIVSHINQRFPLLDPKGREVLLGYIRESLKCGLFSKMELSADVMAEFARESNQAD